MTEKELWKLYVKKNPELRKSHAHMTQKGFKKFFETTYREAYKQAQADVEEFPDIFNMFDKKAK